MEEAGPVRRVPSPEDRRTVRVGPTDQGRAVFVRAAAAHARVVERYFVAPVARDDCTRLTDALRDIRTALCDGAD